MINATLMHRDSPAKENPRGMKGSAIRSLNQRARSRTSDPNNRVVYRNNEDSVDEMIRRNNKSQSSHNEVASK